MKQAYTHINFQSASRVMIKIMNGIIDEYMPAGLRLTVRQLYYQLVARDVIPNNMKSYHLTVRVCTDGRMAGLIDWDAIEDRARHFIRRPNWDSGSDILGAAASSFHKDMWVTQQRRVFVVIEKEALVGVLEGVCHEYDVPLLAAKGYPSVSVLREFAEEDLKRPMSEEPLVIHLGDHDPSGIDMTRDIVDRLGVFYGQPCEVRRIALNMDQVRKHKPPPNPAKQTDARFASYYAAHGASCWELDAMKPDFLSKIVKTEVEKVIDWRAWDDRKAEIQKVRGKITRFAKRFKD